MIERVRALLVTPSNELLIIRRDRPSTPAYWVLPGGHLEPGDADLESGLHREIYEELGGKAEIVSLVAILDGQDDRQHIYLARIDSWSEHDRTGPEFSDSGRGSYTLCPIPLVASAWTDINLKPEAVADIIRQALTRDGGLLALPDLRVQLGK